MVALRTGLELVKGLRYKLRMMGVPLGVGNDEPTSVFCDNQSVVTSSSVPESTLAKKHLGICYHAVRESVAAGILRIAHIDGKENPADCLTKLLTAAIKKKHVGKILY
mmetsp:Transcript_34193/g.68963  ORF Transcript_34193/g.68963 Transcript_34193/m.68963 type:complete len:108 (+) Transcript_34193:89-412(+)